jgi:hypothetical protein
MQATSSVRAASGRHCSTSGSSRAPVPRRAALRVRASGEQQEVRGARGAGPHSAAQLGALQQRAAATRAMASWLNRVG